MFWYLDASIFSLWFFENIQNQYRGICSLCYTHYSVTSRYGIMRNKKNLTLSKKKNDKKTTQCEYCNKIDSKNVIWKERIFIVKSDSK